MSAEGSDDRSVATGLGATTLNVIAIVEVEQGELRLDVLRPDGGVVIALQSRPNEQITRSASIPTGADGLLHYRVVTRGARNGAFQILYQRQ